MMLVISIMFFSPALASLINSTTTITPPTCKKYLADHEDRLALYKSDMIRAFMSGNDPVELTLPLGGCKDTVDTDLGRRLQSSLSSENMGSCTSVCEDYCQGSCTYIATTPDVSSGSAPKCIDDMHCGYNFAHFLSLKKADCESTWDMPESTNVNKSCTTMLYHELRSSELAICANALARHIIAIGYEMYPSHFGKFCRKNLD